MILKKYKLTSIALRQMLPQLTMVCSASATPRKITWDDVTWKKYHIKFKIPAHLKESENDNEKYIAEDENLSFEIYPWKDSTLSEEDVANAAFEDLGLDRRNTKITSDKKRDLNGYKGYEILGEGTLRGKKANFAVLGFIDPNSSMNFAAYVFYWQGKDADEEENIKIERDIIESIEPTN